MKTRPRDYLTRGTLLCQLAEEAAELAQAALKERRTLTNENPTPKTYNQAHVDLLEEIADLYCCLGELLSLEDWEKVAHIRAEKEKHWIEELKGKRDEEETSI